jgi:cobalt-zinc-cadmium efflux system protein
MHGHRHGHSHDHGHDHAHGSGHDHGAHASPDSHDEHATNSALTQRAFRWSTGLNITLVAVEAGVGFAVGSMALLADAGHNASDVLGLLLAWGASRLALRRPTARHTYGMARSTILAALLNAALLLVACGALAWEAIQRIGEPYPVPGLVVMAVAGVALLVNGVSAMLFFRVQHGDLNARGAFLHLVADAAVSLAVVASGAVIWFTNWTWVDPAVSLAVLVAIVWSGWGLMRESLDLALDAVPRGLDLGRIDAELLAITGVRSIHDLHVWPLSTTVAALTAHLEHDGTRDTDALLLDAQTRLAEKFGIRHTTIQFENIGCAQRC